MKIFIILLSKVLYWSIKLLGKNTDLCGKYIMRIRSNILKQLKLPNNIVVITGSNGKSKIVSMTSKVLRNAGFSVANNLDNSNQMDGITTMLLKNVSLNGNVRKDIILIECDENNVKTLLSYIKPKYLLITNLCRNNLMQNGHPEYILNSINEILTQDIRLILNADDPISSLIGYKKEKIIYYGINKDVISNNIGTSKYSDSKYCPNCKHIMKYEKFFIDDFGVYKCESCGYTRKQPNYSVSSIDINKNQIAINKNHNIITENLDIYNIYNVLATYAISRLFGADEKNIVSVLTNKSDSFEYVKTVKIHGKESTFINVKSENIISYNHGIEYVINQKKDCVVILFLDSINSNGNDTSWIWDVNFELLKNKYVKKIVLSGKFYNDLAMRMNYSDIEIDKIISNCQEIKSFIKEEKEDIFIISNFADRQKIMNRG